jgi:thiomorpholine-carboxylate dehydrogenase
VLKESGDVILSKAPIFAEVGEIFARKKAVPRPTTTIFKSVGIAVEDIATARLVYDAVGGGRALDSAIGHFAEQSEP